MIDDAQLKAITSLSASKPADLMDLEVELFPRLPPAGPIASWGFRGQPRTFGTLCPSLQRKFENVKSVTTVGFIERELVEAFRKHYSKLSMSMSDMPTADQIQQGRDLRCLSVMQHYGVPTRLLDWTADFWTAVYFACAGDPEHDAELWYYDRNVFQPASRETAKSRGVAAEQLQPYAPFDPPLLDNPLAGVLLEVGQQLTPRMREQKAHHTVASEIFADHAPLMYQILAGQAGVPRGFFRVVISSRCKDKVLKYLNDHRGVSAGTIFPDFEGLGRFLRWQLDSLITQLL